jgi:hypothetical protein
VGWAFVWMMLGLKIPVIALLWLVWWAAKEPEAEEDRADDGGSGFRRDLHPRPRPPRPPRRGPHAEPPPRAPKRVRARATRPVPARR